MTDTGSTRRPYFAVDVWDGEDKGIFGDGRDEASLDRAVAALADG